ncbi:MAG: AI-2E family transporter [Mucinivorans sp.]
MQIAARYRWIAAAAGLLLVGFLVWYFSTIVLYILASVVFAIIGKPIVRLVNKLHIGSWYAPMWLSALVALLCLMVIVTLLVSSWLPVVVDKLHYIRDFDPDKINQVLGGPMSSLEKIINDNFPSVEFSFREAFASRMEPLLHSEFIQSTLSSITNLIVEISMAIFSICFITFFFLKDDKLFVESVTVLFPSKYEQNITRAISSTTNLLIRYFVGICIESLIKIVFITVPLYFIGFDLSTALIIGLISAVLNVIPYVGPILGAIFGFAIAALAPVTEVTLGEMFIEMGIVFAVFQLFDNMILQPYIYASSVKAHPLEIFIVILMAGYIAGITGMLLAIPAYTVLRVFAKEFFSNMRLVQKLTDSI